MKKLVISIAFVLGFSSVLFASSERPPVDATGDAAIALSAEEIALEEELAEELAINVDEIMNDLMAAEEVTAVKVYDFSGNEILKQEGEIDFAAIPAGAELVMTEGSTHYYIIGE